MSELSGRELDAAVAAMIEPRPSLSFACERVLHDTVSPKGAWVHTHVYDNGDVCETVPRAFSSDVQLAMRVEDLIAERGLQANYVIALSQIAASAATNRGVVFSTWDLIHATPEQRCQAAVSVCG